MLIILEGVDGAGKTTLARQLADALRTAYPADDVKLWNARPPRRHPLDEYERPLYTYRPGYGSHIICDRWHVGEAVYPRVLNRDTSWDQATHRHIELFLHSRGALVVYVDPPRSLLYRQFTDRGHDDLVAINQLDALHAAYNVYFSTTTVPYQTQRSRGPFVVEQIITAARELESQHTVLNPFVTYVGSHNPAVLLVGDVRHPLRHVVQDARRAGVPPPYSIDAGPAFGPYPGTSGHYLLSHLTENLWISGVGLANACDVDDLAELRKTLNYPPTVALGVNAWRDLAGSITNADEGMIAAAPHPQYVRRFHNRQGFAYAIVIADAAKNGVNELGWRPKT